MTDVRILIVDDEAHARERLRRLLAGDASVEIVGEAGTGSEAVAAVGETRPDLMLLDVQMPELDGFGVIRALPVVDLPLVVFVTAFDEHAIAAFDVHAVDYVLKPVEGPRLLAAVARARTRMRQESASRHVQQAALADVASRQSSASNGDETSHALETETAVGAHRADDRLLVRHEGQLSAIRARDVLWIEAQGNYARLNLPGKSYLVRATMTNLEQRFDPGQFARIHRSVIVNLDAVLEFQPWFGGDYVVILKNGSRLKASRHYKARLDRWVLG